MKKAELTIESRENHCFEEFIQLILMKSQLFNVNKVAMPEYDRYLEVRGKVYPNYRYKYGPIVFIRINGELIIIDTQHRANKFLSAGLFSGMKPRLYVRQIRPNQDNKMLSSRIGCPIFSWVQFPAGWDLVDKFVWDADQHQRVAMLASSSNSLRIMKRKPWFAKADELDGFDTAIGITHSAYLKYLMGTKWGVILSKGIYHNTREYEFISNQMPLALNYCPKCDFPFDPDEHFLHLKTVDDLEKLRHEDPEPFHKQSKMLWENYFRPDVASKWLCKIAGINI